MAKRNVDREISPQTKTGDFDLFPPFAKRSKAVCRYNKETVLPVQPRYDDPLWRTESPPSCEEPFSYESAPAPDLISSPSAGMMRRRNGVNVGLTYEKLPTPSQLMGRKRRGQRLQPHTASVLQHIGELKTRQRHMNELKGDKWWGATAVSCPDESSGPQELTEDGSEQLLGLRTDFSLSEILVDNPEVTMAKPYEAASSLTHQFLFTGYKQFPDLAPGGNPMLAFVAGTAHRSCLMTDGAPVNSGESAGFFRSIDDEIRLLQNLPFL